MASEFAVAWHEDGSCTVLGRITARNGSGAATGVNGEGNWLQVADVSAVERKTFDMDSDPDTPTNTATLTVDSSLILDTPVTTNVIWTKDTTGYNFIDDLAATLFPTVGRRIQIEYKVTLSGGAIFHGVYKGTVRGIRGS